VSVVQASTVSVTVELIVDLQAIHLPKGSLHVEAAKESENTHKLKNLSLNLAVLPLQTLPKLHQGVKDELKIQEQRALLIINEVKLNNQ